MGGKHALKPKKYAAKQLGNYFLVVIAESDKRVPGTPQYAKKAEAQKHADSLNENK